MPSIRSIHIAPVKSLALSEVDEIHVGSRGIANDRRFLVLDSGGRVVSQRQIGKLTQVGSEYSVDSGELTLTFPDGSAVTGQPCPVREAATMLWGRVVTGSVIDGEWSDALSSFCGAELTLMKTKNVGACFDEFPVSVLSQASIDYLTGLTGGTQPFRVERFRPTFSDRRVRTARGGQLARAWDQDRGAASGAPGVARSQVRDNHTRPGYWRARLRYAPADSELPTKSESRLLRDVRDCRGTRDSAGGGRGGGWQIAVSCG